MNGKIKNYVDVLFNDVPMTRKAAELKEEILSTMSEHFEAHIAEGKSENQAYTEALADMGDIDTLLESLAPERELKPRIEEYRQKKAKNTAIAVMLYIIGVVAQCAPPAICAVFEHGNEDKAGVIGFICMLLFAAVATGLLIYTKMSVPQDVEPYLVKKKEKFDTSTERGRRLSAMSKLYWMVVTVIYLGISFWTMAWYITWLIWLIASALWQAILLFSGDKEGPGE
ncbi:MAG: hypothetical protein IJL80_07360 [Treponema sp.]|nr:hypothetical protein [Treponema sp.]